MLRGLTIVAVVSLISELLRSLHFPFPFGLEWVGLVTAIMAALAGSEVGMDLKVQGRWVGWWTCGLSFLGILFTVLYAWFEPGGVVPQGPWLAIILVTFLACTFFSLFSTMSLASVHEDNLVRRFGLTVKLTVRPAEGAGPPSAPEKGSGGPSDP